MKDRILIIDDNKDILFSLKILLKKYYEVITDNNPERIKHYLKKQKIDLVLLDMNFTKDSSSGEEGFDYLQEILEIDADAVVIFITAYGGVEKAVRALKAGAFNYIQKPWENEKLLATVSSGIKLRQSNMQKKEMQNNTEILKQDLDSQFPQIIGHSEGMQEVFSKIKKVANTNANVLILGENGTGKELIARAIHKNSLRAQQALVTVDLGSINENVFESELFGHKKGAFTDAHKDREGRFKIAHNGTIFLDEIGNLSLNVQAKLLSVLENKTFSPVGSSAEIITNFRLICATNNDLAEMVNQNEFRQDLLYRINTIEIELPPLRKRGEDIIILAQFYCKNYSKKYGKKIKGISSEAKSKMKKYSWPGNVRELKHCIERAVILSDNEYLQSSDFNLNIQREIDELPSYKLADVEKEIISKVLKKEENNISNAAKSLGISRASLYRRIEKYGL